ncbi:hypothetical protein Gogos_021884 [Gossypium gossypioides]|uniref:Uncharacterized protein n=1 Tax=Gossypium gossypioides TaxID=34282 RepID=A0A7J9D780_GOSGO|nr:hypothetical protein [Gossypium gossypioides]
MRNYKGMWEIAIEREWTNFCLPPEEPTVIPMVQEFYLVLKEREATRPFYEMRTFVEVRGINVLKKGTFFPHLIIELCKRGVVPMEQLDKEMNPLKKLLGDYVYKHYIILQRKQKDERRKRGLQEEDE